MRNKNQTENFPAWKKILNTLIANVKFKESKLVSIQGYSLEEIRKDRFSYLGLGSAKAKVSKAFKTISDKTQDYGGVCFIEVDQKEADRREKYIWVNDEKLKLWLDNMFNYHLKNNTSPENKIFFNKKISIYNLVRIFPRTILWNALSKWEAPQFPSKDFLSTKIFDNVIALYLKNSYKTVG